MGTVHGPEKVFVSPVDSNTVGANVGVILGGEDLTASLSYRCVPFDL